MERHKTEAEMSLGGYIKREICRPGVRALLGVVHVQSNEVAHELVASK